MKLIKQGKTYHARFRSNPKGSGKPKWKKITTHQTQISEARKVVVEAGIPELERAAIAANLTPQVVSRILAGRKVTIASCVKPFEEYMRAVGHSSRTIEAYMLQLRLWAADIKALTPTAIEPKHISKWVNHSGSLATRKYKLAVVKSFFTFLIAKGWCQSNPAALVGINFDAMTHEQKEKKVRTPLTEEQINLLLTKTDDPFWRFATLCAWEAGLRLGDICNLEWPSFGTPGKLAVWTGKTNQRVDFDISARLTGLLSAIPVTDSKFVFPDQRRIISDEKKRAGLSTQFSRLCARCGFKGHFHLLRHAAASNHAKDEMSDILELVKEFGLEKARKLLGHKRAKTAGGYVH